MQKKLIAVAVAGLVSSGAFAQTNVTIYGLIDLSTSFESGTSDTFMKDNTGATTALRSGTGLQTAGATTTTGGNRTSMRSGVYKSSFIGFKGTEDLGGGMKMDFVVETTIAADGNPGVGVVGQASPTANTNNGTGLFADAESSLALTTEFGRFKFGRMPTFITQLAVASDPFLGKGPGGSEQLFILPVSQTTSNNSFRYDLKFGDIYGGYQIAMSENQDGVAQTAAPGTHSTLFAFYKAGPAFATIANTVLRDVTGTNRKYRTANAWVLAGTYDFGVAKLGGTWYQIRSSKAVTDPAAAGNPIDANHYQLGLTVPMGAHAFKVSYVNTNDRRPQDMDGNSWGLGYEYSLSKRTTFYSRLAKVNNTNGSQYGVLLGGGQFAANSQVLTGNEAAASTNGAANRTNAFTLGLMHSF